MTTTRIPDWLALLWLGGALAWAGPEHLARPVLMAVVVDASGSLAADDLAAARRLTLGLLETLPRGSEVAVFAFADQARLILQRSGDADAVRQALASIHISGRTTALHDALYDATCYLRDAAPGRKAVLLLTDGRDEGSVLTLEDGLRLAEDLAIPVFAVGMGRVEERVLRRIAKLTSGEYLPARQAGGERLAARILTQTAEQAAARQALPAARPAPATPASPEALPPSPAKPAAQAAPAEPVSPAEALRRIWTTLALALLAALGLAAILALRRRGRRRCASCGSELRSAEALCELCPPEPDQHPTQRAPLAPPTLLARLGGAEEPLDKTVVLRDDHVLALTSGPGAGALFPLSATRAISLGRSKANDVVLEDGSVSSQHCRIRPMPAGGFAVHDLRSTNGTFVNGNRVTQHALADGDVIRIGETQLQFRRDQKRRE